MWKGLGATTVLSETEDMRSRGKSRHDERRRDERSKEAGGHDDGRLEMPVDGGPGDRLSLTFSHSATQRPNFG